MTTEPYTRYRIRFNSWYVRVLQVEIVCNEHVMHPFRTMKFIWISEWLNRVGVKYLFSSFWEFVNLPDEMRKGVSTRIQGGTRNQRSGVIVK